MHPKKKDGCHKLQNPNYIAPSLSNVTQRRLKQHYILTQKPMFSHKYQITSHHALGKEIALQDIRIGDTGVIYGS